MSLPSASEAPAAVYEDVPSWKALLLLNAGALAYLTFVTDLEVRLSAFDFICAVLVAGTAVTALVGWRRIEVGPGGIRVFKRGRLKLERPLSAFAGLHAGHLDFHAIVLEDGARVWFAGLGDEAGRLLDYLATVRPAPLQTQGPLGEPDVLELLVASVRFPEGHCVGCQRPATTRLAFEARRGFSLGFVYHFVYRTVRAPGCGACVRRRLAVTVAAYVVPLLAIPYCLFVPQFVPGETNDPLKLAVAGFGIGAFIFLQNWGRAFIDHRVLGVSMHGLSADSTRLWIRVRDAALRFELAQLSRATQAPAPQGSTDTQAA
jgi:hypothetical protein